MRLGQTLSGKRVTTRFCLPASSAHDDDACKHTCRWYFKFSGVCWMLKGWRWLWLRLWLWRLFIRECFNMSQYSTVCIKIGDSHSSSSVSFTSSTQAFCLVCPRTVRMQNTTRRESTKLRRQFIFAATMLRPHRGLASCLGSKCYSRKGARPRTVLTAKPQHWGSGQVAKRIRGSQCLANVCFQWFQVRGGPDPPFLQLSLNGEVNWLVVKYGVLCCDCFLQRPDPPLGSDLTVECASSEFELLKKPLVLSVPWN